MNENIDLTQILKDCPKGTKFYSSLHGELLFSYIYLSSSASKITFIKPDSVSMVDGSTPITVDFYRDGRYYPNQGECTIFPSKDQRDWSKFTAPWYKQEKKETKRFDPKTLNVFDKVLARVYNGFWFADFVSVPGDDELCDIPSLVGSSNFNEVIPYNEETKHLLGTDDDAPEYYQYVDEDDEWEDEDWKDDD